MIPTGTSDGAETTMFRDRRQAGRRLAAELRARGVAGPGVVVLGLPQGGVPVAFEVALALDAPLDIVLVRKLGVPFQPDLALGAVGEDGIEVVDHDVLRATGIDPDEVPILARHARATLDRLAVHVLGDHHHPPLDGRTAVVVDDGIATGSTALAACLVARARGAARIVLAVPVAAPSSLTALADVADRVVCLETPRAFLAVGQCYEDFTQVSDQEVAALLHQAAVRVPRPAGEERPAPAGDAQPAPAGGGRPASPAPPGPRSGPAGGVRPARREEMPGAGRRGVRVDVGSVHLAGLLTEPAGGSGLVVFAHGGGSGRFSPRNLWVASVLEQAGLGTLLMDLLTADEERDQDQVFDIELLAHRLAGALTWLRHQPGGADRRIGLFGAGTGSAAALWVAADPAFAVAAVVSRGGRPDLAWARLPDVRVPTLLIVGGGDDLVLALNRRARARLGGDSQLVVVPGASHLFEEPGTMAQVAEQASAWFLHHLMPVGTAP